MTMCVEAWKALNQAIFAASPRYVKPGTPLLEDEDFAEMKRESWGKLMQELG